MTAEAVLDLYRRAPHQELRTLTSLGQHLTVEAIDALVDRNWNVLAKYTDRFPDLAILKQYLDERAETFRKDPDTFMRYSVYRRPSPELREINRRILAVHRSLRRQLSELNKTIVSLKQQGLIKTDNPNPDVHGPHYRAAQELAQRLVRLWFVREVILFGSVARGEARPDSDIDVCLGLVPGWISSYLREMIDRLADEVQAQWTDQFPGLGRKLFDLVRDRRQFREMGFLDAAQVLAKDDTYRFALDNRAYAFEKSSMAGYSIVYRGGCFRTCVLYPAQPPVSLPGYECVLILDCDAAALFSVQLERWRKGYRLHARPRDVGSAVLAKYGLDQRALTAAVCTLAADAVRRMYKTQSIYYCRE